ncbi:MAG TPA: dihydrofolate reductase [Roseiarcus sp.]|nr:dihydrofolate reductase [Roseiarcus sp.]
MIQATVSLVAAVARNGVIGVDNRLAWRVPTDLRRFRALTMGKPLVMGRKTFESIGRLLPGRETIIVTRRADFLVAGAHVARDVETGLALADRLAMGEQNEIIVAGGAEIYAQTIGRADRLLITEVDLAPPGDALFPPIDPAIWREVGRERPPRGERDEAKIEFVEYARRDSRGRPPTGA